MLQTPGNDIPDSWHLADSPVLPEDHLLCLESCIWSSAHSELGCWHTRVTGGYSDLSYFGCGDTALKKLILPF